MTANPFRFNQIVDRKHFCNRDEVSFLSDLLSSGQAAVLIGRRRTGKTSLAYEACRRLNAGVIHADLMRIGSYMDVVKRLTEAALRDGKPPLVNELVRSLVHLRPAMEIDPVGGGAKWTVAPSSRTTPDNVIDTLRLIKRRCGSANRILFMDEFQDLTDLPGHEAFLAQMRAELQTWSGIPVLYAGSDREAMQDLFSDPLNPFYQSAAVITVGNIDPKRFARFIATRFKAGGKTIPPELAGQVLEITGAHPNSTQKLLHFLWNLTPDGAKATESILADALDITIRAEQNEFERAVGNLTLPQIRVLKAVAACGGEHTSSGDFLEAAQMRNASSAQKALERCRNLKFLERDNSGYQFANPFFRQWLLRLP